MAERRGHGWWPYLVPMFAFLALVETGGRAGETGAAFFLPVKVLVPLGLFLYFFARGSYPELRGHRWSAGGVLLDVLVGLAGAVVWMAPYVLDRMEPFLPLDFLRPGDEAAFDPTRLGPSLVGLTLGLRVVGYAVVTPFVEELFVRSWLLRYVEVFDKAVDFRDLPIAHYTLRSFLIILVYFTLSHVPWEYPVAFLWILGTQLWFYHRKSLVSLVIVHATSNLSIFLAALLLDGTFRDAAGNPIPLWFFI